MTEVAEPFSQDPLEDKGWDRAILGKLFQAYVDAGTAELNGVDRARRILVELAATESVAPLAQVLLANALVHPPVLGEPPLTQKSGLGSKQLLNAIRASAPILAAAIARYSGEPQLGLPWISGDEQVAWSPLGVLYLSQLTAQFDDSVSALLHFAGAVGRLTAVRRQQLNGLLFHPLQNAEQHGRNPEQSKSFGGVAARIVRTCDPEPPSFTAYRQSLVERAHSGEEFLEVIVHDNGLGIARHFYAAKRQEGDPELHSLPLFHEWETLYHAFERHQTSKPVSFRRATAQPGAMPGVGLAGLLNALKQLRAYLELRTGRLRVFQWYDDADVISDKSLLQPAGLPAEALLVPGTVFRLMVPLDARGART